MSKKSALRDAIVAGKQISGAIKMRRRRLGELLRQPREATNIDRAGWALEAAKTFARRTGINKEDLSLVLSDLICDLHHLADIGEIIWHNVIVRATDHYIEELKEDAQVKALLRKKPGRKRGRK